jgi:hypothetical protein
MSRISAGLIAALLVAGPAIAQTTAPAIDPSTKLSFPATLGGATLSRSGSMGGGSSYQYTAANGMELTVDIYGGRQRVPNGSSNPVILNQFNDELTILGRQAAGLEKPAVSSACTYGAHTFRCSVFSASGGAAGRLYGKMLLMGYREHFLKILIQWTQKSGHTATEADKVLNAFVPALMPR